MFEVGKKYKRKGIDDVFECLCVYGTEGWMNNKVDTRSTWEWDKWWEEYVEPRKEYFNAYKTPDNGTYYKGPFLSRERANIEERNRQTTQYSFPERYGVLTVTHHSDTTVETHFEVVPSYDPGGVRFTK
jgi:hypothetical protein